TGEILFVKCVKNGIPNRDPLRDSDARRLFGEDDGRISLSDVSVKRDVRDYVLARFPGGGDGKNRFVFVRKELSADGKTLLGRDGLAQFGWAHSLHPVETKYTQGTVCMPSKDAPAAAESPAPGKAKDEDKGKTQGTIWTQYQLPFAVFAMPGIVNAAIAGQTGMTG